ncbi:hypothetical protein BH11ARM2_BH11ARM2_34290 [soil metagenome]
MPPIIPVHEPFRKIFDEFCRGRRDGSEKWLGFAFVSSMPPRWALVGCSILNVRPWDGTAGRRMGKTAMRPDYCLIARVTGGIPGIGSDGRFGNAVFYRSGDRTMMRARVVPDDPPPRSGPVAVKVNPQRGEGGLDLYPNRSGVAPAPPFGPNPQGAVFLDCLAHDPSQMVGGDGPSGHYHRLCARACPLVPKTLRSVRHSSRRSN